MTGFTSTSHIADPHGPSWVERLMSFVGRSHAAACAALIVLSLACFLPGFASLQPIDRDEPRFAQASKQMLETRDFIDIRFQEEARHKKPVGIYWLQAAAVSAGEALGLPEARTTIALYRLPSLLGAIGGVLMAYWAALAFVQRRGAFLSAAMMAACVILMFEARLAKTDAVLLSCSMAVMGGLARAYLGQAGERLPVRTSIIFWLGMAIGILIKGPMVIMFAGLAGLFLSIKERSGHWLLALRPKWGLIATFLVVLPWFIAIAVRSHGEFFEASIGQDMLGKVRGGQEAHGAPPGFYLVSFFAMFWPGAILAAIAVPFAWINRRTREVAFCIAWVLPAWICFEAFPTKLPHYVMPLYPAIAILTVMAIGEKFVGPHRPLARIVSWAIPLIPLILALGLAGGGFVLDRSIPVLGTLGLLIATGVAVSARKAFVEGQSVRCILVSLLASVLVAVSVFGLIQRDFLSLKLSPRLADAARSVKCAERRVGTLGYREPSLVFLAGTNLKLLNSAADAADFMQTGPCGVVFVESRYDGEFRALMEQRNLTPKPVLTKKQAGLKVIRTNLISGFNVNGGKRLDIFVYETRRSD